MKNIEITSPYPTCKRLSWSSLDYIDFRFMSIAQMGFWRPAKNNWTIRFWRFEIGRTQLPF